MAFAPFTAKFWGFIQGTSPERDEKGIKTDKF
jgi:hypothetical protein